MEVADEFESIRTDPDPIRQGKRATALLTVYQQRATELARLRKAAIERARRENNMSLTEIASALGLTKSRVTQIRSTAPKPERAFFGVGPIAVGTPYRYQETDRIRPLVAAEDAQTGQRITTTLESLTLAVTQFQIEPDHDELPEGDAVVICGPKSAPIAAALLARDPALEIVEDGGRWWIQHQTTGERYGSPTDDSEPRAADVAYLARHRINERTIVHVAGIHGIGSLGVAEFLSNNLSDIYAEVGDVECSLAVRAEYDGLTIKSNQLTAGPYVW